MKALCLSLLAASLRMGQAANEGEPASPGVIGSFHKMLADGRVKDMYAELAGTECERFTSGRTLNKFAPRLFP